MHLMPYWESLTILSAASKCIVSVYKKLFSIHVNFGETNVNLRIESALSLLSYCIMFSTINKLFKKK